MCSEANDRNRLVGASVKEIRLAVVAIPSPPTFSTSSSSGRAASGVKPGVEGSTLLLGGFFHFLCQSVGFYSKRFVKDSFHVLGPLLHRFTRLA